MWSHLMISLNFRWRDCVLLFNILYQHQSTTHKKVDYILPPASNYVKISSMLQNFPVFWTRRYFIDIFYRYLSYRFSIKSTHNSHAMLDNSTDTSALTFMVIYWICFKFWKLSTFLTNRWKAPTVGTIVFVVLGMMIL